MSRDFRLVDYEGGKSLVFSLGGAELTVPLDGADLWGLAQVGLASVAAASSRMAPPPYGVVFRLQDWDTGDGPSVGDDFHWVVLVDDRDLAGKIRDRVCAELESTEAFSDGKSDGGYVELLPGRHFDLECHTKVDSVAGALKDLRETIFEDVVDSEDRNYWVSYGFTHDDKLFENLDDFQSCYQRGADLAEHIDLCVAANPDYDYAAEFPGLEKFRRWASGMSATEEG